MYLYRVPDVHYFNNLTHNYLYHRDNGTIGIMSGRPFVGTDRDPRPETKHKWPAQKGDGSFFCLHCEQRLYLDRYDYRPCVPPRPSEAAGPE